MKIIFYADKAHLSAYARPITGDTYIAMEDGPVPSLIYDLLKREMHIPDEMLDYAHSALEVIPRKGANHSAVHAKREPNLDVLSVSDQKCLMESISRFADMSWKKLSDESHDEPAYRAVSRNQEMPVELIVAAQDDREAILQQIRETADALVL